MVNEASSHDSLRTLAACLDRGEEVTADLHGQAAAALPDWSERAAEGDEVTMVYRVPVCLEDLRASLSEGDEAPEWLEDGLTRGLIEGRLTDAERQVVAAAWALDTAESVGEWHAALWEYSWPGGLTLVALQHLDFDDWGDYRVAEVEFARTRGELLGLRAWSSGGQCYFLA